MLTNEVKKYIRKSVLCWLATSDKDNMPNVSPKEMFTFADDNTLIVANIASPNTIQNIDFNPNVCISFLDIFIQKGYKIKGIARIIEKSHETFAEKVTLLTALFGDTFPIKSIIEIEIKSVEKIVAPSYFLFAATTEENQIKNAMITYNVKPID